MRNTYTLIDLGNFVSGSSKDKADGYIQMLPLTDFASAKDDFVKVRMGGVDTTGDAKYYLLPASDMQHSPESSSEKKAHLAEKVLGRWPYILVGSLLLLIIIVGYICWRCCCRKRWQERKKAKAAAAFAAGGGGGGSGGGAGHIKRISRNTLQMNTLRSPSTYQPLGERAPSPSGSYTYGKGDHPPAYDSGYGGHRV